MLWLQPYGKSLHELASVWAATSELKLIWALTTPQIHRIHAQGLLDAIWWVAGQLAAG